MISSRKKTTIILAIGNYSILIIDIIQGIIFVPLYLEYIGTRLYGLWLGTGGILAILAFLDMGIATMTIQRISNEFGKKNMEGVSRYFSNGILINFIFMSLLGFLGLFLSLWIGGIFSDITESERQVLTVAFQIALLALIISLMNNLVEGTLNALHRPLAGKLFQFAGAVVGIFVVYFLLLGSQPLLAIPIGMLIKSSITLFPNLIYLSVVFIKNNTRLFNFNKATIKDYLDLTPNLLLSKIGTATVSNIEPTLITMFISPEITVFYSITKKAGDVIRTILDRVGGILYPSIANLYSEDRRGYFSELIIKLNRTLLPVTIVLFLSYISLNETFVSLWVGEEKYLGNLLTVLIALSLFVGFYSNLYGYLLSSTGDIKFSSNAVFIESIIKLFFLILGLKIMGVYGLPVSTVIVSSLFIFIYLKRWSKYITINKVNSIMNLEVVHLAVFLIISSVLINLVLVYLEVSSVFVFLYLSISVTILYTLVIVLLVSECRKWIKNYLINIYNKTRTVD